MSQKTKLKRAKKEAKRNADPKLRAKYRSPVKFKPREMLWVRYARTGARYEPYETEAQAKARQQAEERDLVDAGT